MTPLLGIMGEKPCRVKDLFGCGEVVGLFLVMVGFGLLPGFHRGDEYPRRDKGRVSAGSADCHMIGGEFQSWTV